MPTMPTMPGLPGAQPAERRLGPLAAVSLVLGAIFGIGIFLTPVEMARGVGAPGWVFAIWLVTGGMAVSGALVYGELATRFPHAGGPYVYLREAYGAPLAFLYGWNCLLVMDPGLAAAVAIGAAQYAAFLLPLSPAATKGFAIAVILGIAVLTALGTRLAGGVILAMTALKVAALLVLVGWGFASGGADLGALTPLFDRPAGAPPIAAGLAGGFVSAFFTYGGWWDAAKIAGEIENPRRTLPFVFATGVGIATALYLLASATLLSAVRGLGAAELAAMTAPRLGELLLGPTGGGVLAALVLVSALGSLAASMLSTPRLYVAMAEDGLFPRRLAARHPRLGTPLGAIAVQAARACVLGAIGPFGSIVAYFIFATVAFITLSVAAVFRLPPPALDAYRAPARKWVAGVFVTLSLLLLTLLLAGNPKSSGAGVGVVALGLPVFFAIRRRARSDAT
jgi:APA family basic amino acid/polyamine antiporter